MFVNSVTPFVWIRFLLGVLIETKPIYDGYLCTIAHHLFDEKKMIAIEQCKLLVLGCDRVSGGGIDLNSLFYML